METVERKIDKLGRIVLPMDFRKTLGLEGEVKVVLGIKNNTITIQGIRSSCKLCGASAEVSECIGVCSKCIRKIKSI